GLVVPDAAVRLVGRYFGHGEGFRGLLNQPRELRRIVRVTTGNLDCRDHVRLDAAHDVGLDPRVLPTRGLAAVLVIEPRFKAAGRKPGGIDCEVNLNRLQWAAALGDQRAKDRGQVGALQRVQYGVVAGKLA